MAVIRPVSIIWKGILPERKYNGSHLLHELFLTYKFQKIKFCWQDVFLVFLALPGGNLRADTDSSHFRKTGVTIQHATKRMNMTSVAREQTAPQVGVNPIGI